MIKLTLLFLLTLHNLKAITLEVGIGISKSTYDQAIDINYPPIGHQFFNLHESNNLILSGKLFTTYKDMLLGTEVYKRSFNHMRYTYTTTGLLEYEEQLANITSYGGIIGLDKPKWKAYVGLYKTDIREKELKMDGISTKLGVSYKLNIINLNMEVEHCILEKLPKTAKSGINIKGSTIRSFIFSVGVPFKLKSLDI